MPKSVDPVDLTCALVNLNTMNPPGNEEAAAKHVGEIPA
jgi:hypothetical protein